LRRANKPGPQFAPAIRTYRQAAYAGTGRSRGISAYAKTAALVISAGDVERELARWQVKVGLDYMVGILEGGTVRRAVE
jgi:hypothetical protein